MTSRPCNSQDRKPRCKRRAAIVATTPEKGGRILSFRDTPRLGRPCPTEALTATYGSIAAKDLVALGAARPFQNFAVGRVFTLGISAEPPAPAVECGN